MVNINCAADLTLSKIELKIKYSSDLSIYDSVCCC